MTHPPEVRILMEHQNRAVLTLSCFVALCSAVLIFGTLPHLQVHEEPHEHFGGPSTEIAILKHKIAEMDLAVYKLEKRSESMERIFVLTASERIETYSDYVDMLRWLENYCDHEDEMSDDILTNCAPYGDVREYDESYKGYYAIGASRYNRDIDNLDRNLFKATINLVNACEKYRPCYPREFYSARTFWPRNARDCMLLTLRSVDKTLYKCSIKKTTLLSGEALQNINTTEIIKQCWDEHAFLY
jgi:hypothetical protein